MFKFGFESGEAITQDTFEATLEADQKLREMVDSAVMGFVSEDAEEGLVGYYDEDEEQTFQLQDIIRAFKQKGIKVDLPTLRRLIAKRIDPTGEMGHAEVV